MSRPDFKTMATEWLVRAQGHARAPHEESLAEELRRAYELGAAHAIEAVHETARATVPSACCSATLEEAVECIRDATSKP